LEKQSYDDGGCCELPPPPPNNPGKTIRINETRDVIHIYEINYSGSANSRAPNYKFSDTIIVDNRISKVGVIDFANSIGYNGDLVGLNIAKDNLLIIKNWNSSSALRLYSRSIDLADQTKRIAFEIDGKLVKATWVYKVHKKWPGWSKWDYLWPTAEPWVPAPEPTTYGAIFTSGMLGFAGFWRRSRVSRPSRPSSPCGGNNSRFAFGAGF